MTDLPSHYYDSIYGNDPAAENPFGLESLNRRCTGMFREFIRRGGSPAEFARQSAAARARLPAPFKDGDALLNSGMSRSHHCDLPAISKREDVA